MIPHHRHKACHNCLLRLFLLQFTSSEWSDGKLMWAKNKWSCVHECKTAFEKVHQASRWRVETVESTPTVRTDVHTLFCSEDQTTDDHLLFSPFHFVFFASPLLLFKFHSFVPHHHHHHHHLSLCLLSSGTETKAFGSNSKCHESIWMLCAHEANSMTTSNAMIYHTRACVRSHMGMCSIRQFCLHILVKMKKRSHTLSIALNGVHVHRQNTFWEYLQKL